MVKKRSRPAPRNTHKPPDTYDFIQHCAKVLKARVAAGVYRDRPGLEVVITEFDPALALIEIAADPASTPDMRAAVSAKLMPYWHKEQSLLVKEAGGGNAPVSITVMVAPWAAVGKPSAPALSAPDETIIEPGTPQNNNTPPTPPLNPDTRERERMAARAARETVVMDVPPQPDKPRTVLAHVSQARGVVKPLTLEQKLENKGVGRQREAAPETAVSSNFPLFGR
jgi:hypothetical protein